MKIKNINKKLLAEITALVVVAGVAANETIISKQTTKVKDPYTKVIEAFQEDTLLDEAEQENSAMYKDMTISEAADKVLELIESQKTLNNQEKKWLEDNAKEVTMGTLLWSIKSSVANELGIPIEEIQNIELPYTNEYKELVLCMTYNHKEYKISKKDKYILNALYLYYQVKSEDLKDDPDYSIIETALNSAKILTMTAVTEDNYTLNTKRDLKIAKKLLK